VLNPDFAILGAIINFAGGINYAIDTLKGRAKPNRVTWSLWAIAPLIAFAAELAQGVKIQSVVTLSAGLAPMLILACSFANKKAYWKIKPFDWYCAGVSLLALILWLITGKGDIAILFSVLADFMAALPTIIKSYRHPETESLGGFAAGTAGVFIGFLTIHHWTFANYAFPTYLVLCNGVITTLIASQQYRKNKKNVVAAS
jgi:hypothetical protein